MKLSQNHLSKLKGEKPWLSAYFDAELCEVSAQITGFKYPAILTLEEQGQFALGYYHKKQATWDKAQQNKELKDLQEIVAEKEIKE